MDLLIGMVIFAFVVLGVLLYAAASAEINKNKDK
jgi:hypothetical protein